MKSKFIPYYLGIAYETAKLSSANRAKVGAIIVKDDRIISIGYNGMPSGWDNECEEVVPPNEWVEVEQLKTKPEVLHAETNAIAKVAQSTETSEGSTMFCTHAPCVDCAKLIYQSGIATLYFKHEYRDDAGLKFLKLSGVNVHNHVQH